MIKSMTGYGKAEASFGSKKITVEIRSLNSKQTDLSVKIPSIYRPCEYDIRGSVAKRLQRGKIDLFVSYETEASNQIHINRTAFGQYCCELREIARENNMQVGHPEMDAVWMSSILRLPEVVQNESATIDPEELEVLKKTAEEAMDRLEEFRLQEGAILMNDLRNRIQTIETLKNSVTPYEASRTEKIKNRIREQLEKLNVPLDSNRLEQEMIFYIEKLDVTEEKVRLQNHCDYFREVADSEEGVGRKLGFIAQEIGREINTLGSKANDSTIQKIVVQMKDELEKIKEQLLNIL